MRHINPGLRSLRRRPALALAAGVFLVAVALVVGLGSPPASAQGDGDWTVLLIDDGAVLCADELASVLAWEIRRPYDFVELHLSRYRENWVRPEHVSAVLSVHECPKNAIVIPDGGWS